MTAGLLSRGALLLLDKPEGITSHDAVERVRRATGIKKIGHTGTLDPMATGLLVLCCSRAARLQGLLTGLPKSYEGTITLGRATDTYDREGKTTSNFEGEIALSPGQLETAAAVFRGEFEQTPPPFSAKKVGGRKFYEMARKGETVPQAPKKVTVTRFELESTGPTEIKFTLSCSSGTYIRSIAHDLGGSLGFGAHLSKLRRTSIGNLEVSSAVALADFERMDPEARESAPHALALSEIPFPFPKMTVASLEAWKLKRGQSIPARISGREGEWIALHGSDGEMLALGQMVPIGTGKISMIKPRIVLAD